MLDIKKYGETIEAFYNELLEAKEEMASIKLSEDKWSLKEIIGHLIDSASNNHQRFVRLQFGDLLDFPAYNGEEWIKAQDYNDMKWSGIVALWYNYNCLLLNIIENSSEAIYENVWVKNEDEAIPFEKLAGDYFKHIELHIEHFRTRKSELS